MKKFRMFFPIIICFIIALSFCACKKQNTEKETDSNSLESSAEIVGDSGETAVTDEATLDYGYEDGEKTESTAKSSNSQAQASGDGFIEVTDNADTNTATSSKQSSHTSTDNPFDKNGDGYVDGWY